MLGGSPLPWWAVDAHAISLAAFRAQTINASFVRPGCGVFEQKVSEAAHGRFILVAPCAPGEEYETNVDWADGRKSIIGFHGELETTTYPNGKMAHYSPGGHAGSHVHGPVSLWSVEHLDGTQDFFHDHAQDDTDDEDASWNVREDCISKERLSERVYPNGDRHYFCPYNDNRTTQIHRAVEGHLVPVRPAQVLWYRVREWFKRRTIVLHWQEQTQMRLYGPSGTGRLADHAAFVSEFVN